MDDLWVLTRSQSDFSFRVARITRMLLVRNATMQSVPVRTGAKNKSPTTKKRILFTVFELKLIAGIASARLDRKI